MKYFKKIAMIALVLVAVATAGNSKVQAKGVSLNAKNLTMYGSQKKELKADITLPAYSGGKIVFTSSNKKVAKVNKNGVITAKNKGKAVITAKIKGTSKKAKCKVRVLANIKKINITANTTKFYVGQKYVLTAVTNPEKADEGIKWKSMNKKIVHINQKGEIKVKKQGRVTIKAIAKKTKKTKKIVINAEEIPRIAFSEGKKLMLTTGQSSQLHLQFINRPSKPYTYQSVDSKIVKVSQTGVVTAVRPGQAYIKAVTTDKKEQVSICVIVEQKEGFITKSMLDNLDIDDRTNLMIVAHPDDETLWGGAHLKEGKWFIVCMTNQYTASRKAEYKKMLAASGAKGIILDYPDVIFREDGKWDKDNWTYVRDAAYKDALEVIKYKNWNLIASHSPAGETGHRQHKQTDQAVTKACLELNVFNKLWYFGKFYEKGMVPAGLNRITDEELTFKQGLLDIYVGEKGSIKSFWEQMTPYENWVKATDYK